MSCMDQFQWWCGPAFGIGAHAIAAAFGLVAAYLTFGKMRRSTLIWASGLAIIGGFLLARATL